MNPDKGVSQSASNSSLLNRLKPKNEVSMASKSNGGFNTLQPKASKLLQSSISSPALFVDKTTVESPSKSSNVGLNLVVGKTLSSSYSAAFLSHNSNIRENFIKSRSLSGEKGEVSTNNLVTLTPRGESKYEEFSESDHYPVDGGKIPVQRNSFVASLNLSQKQLFDLFKIPQTFFYLRIKILQNSIESSSGSVYDLEVVSLDQVDKNSYFTLSKEGITQFRNKVSSFTGLTQWER